VKGLGSGDNGEFTFLDIITLVSFYIGIMNYDENLTQSDKQEIENQLSSKIDLLLNEIHSHLEAQDRKIDFIIERLEK
jgi:hypothetical protein